MKVLITGGAGFLGSRLAKQLLERASLTSPDGKPEPIEQILLVDITAPTDFGDRRVLAVTGDIADPVLARDVVTPQVNSVFHLAAIVSGQAESDFDLGMRINLDATRVLLDACRRLPRAPRVVFTSSVAVYGGDVAAGVADATALVPQNSYGTQKAIAELLLNDYSRKGFVDGRALRLPTISVRPGKPNRAASSFASGIIREPLSGLEAICPVGPDTRIWLASPRKAVEGLILGHELPAESLGYSRSVNLPGVSMTAGGMVAALEKVAGAEVAKRVRWERDPDIERIVCSWPGSWDVSRALRLGFTGDADFESIIRAYIEDDLPK